MNRFILVLCSLFFALEAVATPLIGSADQTASNDQGQYNAMDMGYAGFTSYGMTQAAWLDPLQNLGEGQTKPAYSKYYWSSDLVLPIRLRESMITMINFPEWEMIESVQFGNAEAFGGKIEGPNTVLLWSSGPIGVDSNVVMFGRSGNKYVFYVKSESFNTERLTNSIVDIVVPQENADAVGTPAANVSSYGGGGYSGSNPLGGLNTATRRLQKNDWIKEIPFNPDNLRFDMEVYVPNPADVVIAPERVWRDDVFTYIDLGEKSLTMVQRPIVTQIVERSEMPVGFRTKGPNNRLIIVEGIGDFVLRNGKRIICLKLRKNDSKGSEDYTSYEDDPAYQNQWDVPPPLPNFGNQGGNSLGNYNNGAGGQSSIGFGEQSQSFGGQAPDFIGYGGSRSDGDALLEYGSMNQQRIDGFVDQYAEASYGEGYFGDNISVQLGTGDDIEEMELLWANLSTKYSDTLSGYEPFFSIDAPANGEGKELYHLRINPISSIEEGDGLCSQLGRRGVFCSVVRTQ